MRIAKLKSLAKINLDLRVLNKRADGFHELRTVFQTISLADTIEIRYEPARRTELALEGNFDIPGNLILHAAEAFLDLARAKARIGFHLEKRIPMGAGLGGGSSNAAAVLLALPVLSGAQVSLEKIAINLGSDVPFFLLGGSALALGRGTELYPLTEVAEQPILIAASGLHVATGPAYAALERSLTFDDWSNRINDFQGFVRALSESGRADLASAFSENDFEAVVFRQYPKLRQIQAKLSKFGNARMTGSGSSIFALFASIKAREGAFKALQKDQDLGCAWLPARLVSRRSYQRLWRRQLREHIAPNDESWPPRSRYER